MQHFAYRVFKTLTTPKFSGTVSANSMDEAVTKVIASCKIKVITETRYFSQEEVSEFFLGDEKVGILIYANPEDYKESK